jgi:membrane protein YdbS with pleckstrin-like domain
MKLSKPKVVTWWIAVIVGLLGILGALVTIPFVSQYAIWFIAFAFILLALATYFKNL